MHASSTKARVSTKFRAVLAVGVLLTTATVATGCSVSGYAGGRSERFILYEKGYSAVNELNYNSKENNKAMVCGYDGHYSQCFLASGYDYASEASKAAMAACNQAPRAYRCYVFAVNGTVSNWVEQEAADRRSGAGDSSDFVDLLDAAADLAGGLSSAYGSDGTSNYNGNGGSNKCPDGYYRMSLGYGTEFVCRPYGNGTPGNTTGGYGQSGISE